MNLIGKICGHFSKLPSTSNLAITSHWLGVLMKKLSRVFCKPWTASRVHFIAKEWSSLVKAITCMPDCLPHQHKARSLCFNNFLCILLNKIAYCWVGMLTGLQGCLPHQQKARLFCFQNFTRFCMQQHILWSRGEVSWQVTHSSREFYGWGIEFQLLKFCQTTICPWHPSAAVDVKRIRNKSLHIKYTKDHFFLNQIH